MADTPANHTVRLYEKDERGLFWPAGKYTYRTLGEAMRALWGYHTNTGLSGLVTTPEYIKFYLGMSRDEAMRVSPVKAEVTQ